jgi:hypothetical protein
MHMLAGYFFTLVAQDFQLMEIISSGEITKQRLGSINPASRRSCSPSGAETAAAQRIGISPKTGIWPPVYCPKSIHPEATRRRH